MLSTWIKRHGHSISSIKTIPSYRQPNKKENNRKCFIHKYVKHVAHKTPYISTKKNEKHFRRPWKKHTTIKLFYTQLDHGFTYGPKNSETNIIHGNFIFVSWYLNNPLWHLNYTKLQTHKLRWAQLKATHTCVCISICIWIPNANGSIQTEHTVHGCNA